MGPPEPCGCTLLALGPWCGVFVMGQAPLGGFEHFMNCAFWAGSVSLGRLFPSQGAEPSDMASLLNLLSPWLPLSQTFFRIGSSPRRPPPFWLHGMWDLSSLTRDQTCGLCSGSMES